MDEANWRREDYIFTKEDLEELFNDSYSVQNREIHGKSHIDIRYAGRLEKGDRIYDFYIDEELNGWFEILYKSDKGPVSEYEHIFGRKPRKRVARWSS